jgi:uncharacterized protein
MTTKEQVIRLENADEIRANLPLSGAILVAKLEGELQAGSALDIALVLVGNRRTTWSNVTPADLKGSCQGATHYVRGAMVGAFAMQTEAKAKTSSAVQIFGAGTSGNSSSAKSVSSRDGKIDDCKAATPDDPSPRAGCGVPVRLELIALQKAEAAAAEGDGDSESAGGSCPAGLTMSEGKCTTKQFAKCDPKDPSACDRACNEGSMSSCASLARMYAMGRGLTKNPAKAVVLAQKACEGGSGYGCWARAELYEHQDKDLAKAFEFDKRACDSGYANGCMTLGYGYSEGRWPGGVDELKAVTYAEKACNGGNQTACNNLGTYYQNGKGVAKSWSKAAGLFKRACDGGNLTACSNGGRLFLDAKGSTKDEALGFELLERGCKKHDQRACAEVGSCYEKGTGVKADLGRAVEIYTNTCNAKEHFRDGCYYLGRLYLSGKGVPKDKDKGLALLKKSCDAKEERACKKLAKVDAADD